MSNTRAPIFTHAPLGFDRKPSYQFSSYNVNGAPCPVSEVSVTMVNTSPSNIIITCLFNLWAFLYSAATNARQETISGTVALPATRTEFDLSPRPLLTVTLNKANETKENALVTAGFGKRSTGRYRYYQGPATNQAVTVALGQGCDTGAFAPGNAVSINGYVLYMFFSRILFTAFHIIHTFDYTITEVPSGFDMPKTLIDSLFKLGSENLTELPEKGFFFPYFDGLVLPDSAATLTRFTRLFGRLFGPSPSSCANAQKTFGSGWASLSSTVAGKEYSHMLFLIDLAITSGVKLRPVYLSGTYCGCVFYTETCVVSLGSTIYVPQDKEGLNAGITKLKSHDAALAEICAILSAMEKPDGDEEEVWVVSPSSITSARHLHNSFRTRTFNDRQKNELVALVKKLRFEQNLWDVTNPEHVRQAVHSIILKQFPDSIIPFSIRLTDALFTKNPIYSTLAAFGNKAPSLRGGGTQILRRIAADFYKKIDKPGVLTGIPVFAKAHNEALTDWDGVLSEFTVWFDAKGKDKQGKIRVKNVASYIPFDTSAAKDITRDLVQIVGAASKRKREEGGEEVVEDLEKLSVVKKRSEKKARYDGLGIDLVETPAGEMDVDSAIDFFSL